MLPAIPDRQPRITWAGASSDPMGHMAVCLPMPSGDGVWCGGTSLGWEHIRSTPRAIQECMCCCDRVFQQSWCMCLHLVCVCAVLTRCGCGVYGARKASKAGRGVYEQVWQVCDDAMAAGQLQHWCLACMQPVGGQDPERACKHPHKYHVGMWLWACPAVPGMYCVFLLVCLLGFC